jgi:hypothetical protein
MIKFHFEEELPVLYLDFNEELEDEGMERLSFVDKPATEMNWRFFEKQEFQESYRDYPKSASENACRAIKYRDNNPKVDCGTRVGWTRAQQLCNNRPLSVETIARMASFKRMQQHKDIPYDVSCGGLMYDAWGGETGVDWAIRKLQQINNQLRMLGFEKQMFQEINEEKRMVTAPVMLAETKILRYSPDLGKYYVKFSKDTILKMMKKYFKENKIHNINTDHDENAVKDDVYMIESYIVDDRNQSKLYPDLPEGSWIATYLVDNDDVWEKIKEGEYNGFSLEGYFIEKYEDDMVDSMLLEIQSTLKDYTDETLIEKKIKRILGME